MTISGFYLSSALWMMLAAVVPFLLHIRFRKRIVQVIPSLHLFQLNRKRRRRFWLENLLLLLSRSMMLFATAFMLSQPYFLTLDRLPFYDMAGRIQEGPILGILLDDRNSSRMGSYDGERLDVSLKWIQAQLESLPEGSKVCLATTTYARVSRWMSPKEALERLPSFRASDENEGIAGQALSNLYKKVRGRWGSVLIAAPMDVLTWRGSDEVLRQPARLPVAFLDTQRWKSPVFLREVQGRPIVDGAEELRYDLLIDGSEDALLKASIQVFQNGVLANQRMLDEVRDGQGRAEVALPLLDQVSTVEFRVVTTEGERLAWDAWHATAPSMGRHSTGRWLLLGRGERASFDEALLRVVIERSAGERPVERFDLEGEDPSTYGEASRIVMLGTHELTKEHIRWLMARLKNGAQVICLPMAEPVAGQGEKAPFLPKLERWSPLAAGEWLPLSLGLRVNDADLEGLLARGVDRLSGSALVDVQWPESFQVVLAGRHGELILSRTRVGAWGRVDALALPLTQDPDSMIYHPMFPLLIDHLLQQSSVARLARGGETISGSPVRMDQWFGQAMLDGDLVYPSGYRQRTVVLPGRSMWSIPEDPGVYRFEDEQAEILAIANEARPSIEVGMEVDQWESRYPLLSPRLMEVDTLLTDEDHVHMTEDPEALTRHQYDLSILFAFGALVFLVLETFFAWLAWMRWKKGYQ